MVFFVCEGCNETLKKNKVDAHAARCRNCYAVSCVDCSVVFPGNEYAAHTSCISEAQKYEGALYKAKAKKMSPQERWMDVVANAKAPTPGDSKLQNVLDRVAGYDNVPRKKTKYINFMKNSIGMNDAATIEKVWTVLEDMFKKSDEDAKKEDAAEKMAKTEQVVAPVEDKKRKSEQSEEPDAAMAKKKAKKDEPIKWAKLIKAALKKAEGKQLDLETLCTAVVQSIVDKKLSTLDETQLKTEFTSALRAADSKFAVVEVVRLT